MWVGFVVRMFAVNVVICLDFRVGWNDVWYVFSACLVLEFGAFDFWELVILLVFDV